MAIIFNPLEFSSALSIICDPDPAGKILFLLVGKTLIVC